MTASLAVAALAAAGCGGDSGSAAEAEAAARSYLRAEGPAVCGFLSSGELAEYARGGGEPAIAACREAKRLQQGDTLAESVEARGPVTMVYAQVDGAIARVEGIGRQGRSVELDLVREDGEWRVDADPDEIAGDASLVGVRLAPTEEALFGALLFGPVRGDDAALAAAKDVTARYIELVAGDEHLGEAVKRRKLAWATRLTEDGSCDPCRSALLSAQERVAYPGVPP